MFEKVNMYHPDKCADRIAGALVDLCYEKEARPRCAFEVLVGHRECYITGESSVQLTEKEVKDITKRIIGGFYNVSIKIVPQDEYLAENQAGCPRCGDNGIFKGVPVRAEAWALSYAADCLSGRFESDGKYIISNERLIICQSMAQNADVLNVINNYNAFKRFGVKISKIDINPLGYWTGSPEVDAGATNRKLGSDMGDSLTGGGLCGKDLSKADVSVNVYLWLLAQKNNKAYRASCAIGDEFITIEDEDETEYFEASFNEVMEVAGRFIWALGGFEKFAAVGLINPISFYLIKQRNWLTNKSYE